MDFIKNNTLNNTGMGNSYPINSIDANGNTTPNGVNYINNFSTNNTFSNQPNYIPDKKHYPANFDMLFDPALLNSGPSLLDGNSNNIPSELNASSSNEPTQPKKDPFEFVNDFLKPRK
jgi:hypothetical protein